MSHESVKALERIVTLCEASGNLTCRQVKIFDIALEGLGMVRKQREEITYKWRTPHEQKMRERIQRRRDKLEVV